MKIWKFPLDEVVTNEVINLDMPRDAKILHVRSQKNIPCLWALVDPLADVERRLFCLAATGESLPEGEYLGTVFQYNGAYVWHVLEVTDD